MDRIIRNVRIIDGTGKPGFTGDIGVKKGLIEKVGNLAGETAKEDLDGHGLTVTPGFIDITNHSDVSAALFLNPGLESLVRQGITTIIGGNCGVSLAPLTDPDIIHGIRQWAPTSAINVNWLTVAEFLKELEARKLTLNFGMLVGHGAIRRGVTHEEARPLTPEELGEAKLVLERALADGALGLSSNLGAPEERDGTTDEIIELCKTVAHHHGVYKPHLRNEGRNFLAALNEALRIGFDARVTVVVSHLKAVGRSVWHEMHHALNMLTSATENRQRIFFDFYPYPTTGSQLLELLPAWVRAGGFHQMLERLENPELRVKILEDLGGMTLHYDRIRIAEAEDGISPGKTIQALALRMEADPRETMLRILRANRGRVTIIGRTLSSKNLDLLVRHPLGVAATNGSAYGFLPDPKALPHPRSFGAFPHFLHRFARERQLISWEEAIHKITGRPAEIFGIRNRGTIAASMQADLVMFDAEKLRDRSTYKNPYQPPEGIGLVMVNGIPVLSNGVLTGERPGQIIRRS